MSQSSAISINSGGLGQITQTTGALYVLDTVASKFVPVTGSLSQSIAWDGTKWVADNGFSRRVYDSATTLLPVSTVVALSSSGLTAADSNDRLKSNAFGVVQASGSKIIVQTSDEVRVAFSTRQPAAAITTGSVFYVSSSGTASLYEDITGSVAGRYATQIGYLNRSGSDGSFIILQPRVFGLVY